MLIVPGALDHSANLASWETSHTHAEIKTPSFRSHHVTKAIQAKTTPPPKIKITIAITIVMKQQKLKEVIRTQ